jgi:hypothetical protein
VHFPTGIVLSRVHPIAVNFTDFDLIANYILEVVISATLVAEIGTFTIKVYNQFH